MSVEMHGSDAVAPPLGPRPETGAAPAAMFRVTLTLARCPEHPDGSVGRGYQIVAPLGPDGRLDAALWRETRDHCRCDGSGSASATAMAGSSTAPAERAGRPG